MELNPKSGAEHFNLGMGLERFGRNQESADAFRRALQLEPRSVKDRVLLATLLTRLGQTAEAQDVYRQSLQLDPQWPEERCRLAWLLATSPIPVQRDGDEAVLYAESACNAIHPQPAEYLDVLGAAYAESGRFADAAAAAEKAVAAAESRGQSDLARAITGRLALYRDRRPFHRAPPPPR